MRVLMRIGIYRVVACYIGRCKRIPWASGDQSLHQEQSLLLLLLLLLLFLFLLWSMGLAPSLVANFQSHTFPRACDKFWYTPSLINYINVESNTIGFYCTQGARYGWTMKWAPLHRGSWLLRLSSCGVSTLPCLNETTHFATSSFSRSKESSGKTKNSI